jgi:hypothetical protein
MNRPRAKCMQRNPVETDFVIEVHPTTIEILFVPTGTWFTFRRFTERKDIFIAAGYLVGGPGRGAPEGNAWENLQPPSVPV